MDRKGWIILLFCGLALVLNHKFSQSNKEAVENQRQQQEQLETPKPGLKEEPPKVVVKEEFHEVVIKNDSGDAMKYVFTNKGGGLKAVEFLQQEEAIDGPVVLNKYGETAIGALSQGVNRIEKVLYSLDEEATTDGKVVYRGKLGGVDVVKEWVFAKEGDAKQYQLTLNVLLKNVGNDSAFDSSDFSVTTGVAAPLFQDERPDLCHWFYYDDEYESGDQKPFTDGWFGRKAATAKSISGDKFSYFGVANQFFTVLVRPKESGKELWITSREVKLESHDEDEKRRIYLSGLQLPSRTLSKGDAGATFSYDFYTGPRKFLTVKGLGENVDETMHYGVMGFMSPWMNHGLNWIHDTIGVKIHEPWSWGIAIVLLTVLIRIIIWPLHNKSTRTMKRMGKLQPLMKEIREKYKDEPQKQQQETIALYRKYGVNPMGGCLPMLVQIPIFFGVFGMLNNAVELRGQSFLGWVTDLSQPDTVAHVLGVPINILPILMAVTMVLQMRMTPQTGDKLQRRIFMLMPLIFFFFCYNFASALALYWTTQNIVSIGQTWLMQRLPEAELEEVTQKASDPNKPRKKGFMERMAEKLEEAQKLREEQMAAKTGQAPPSARKNAQQAMMDKQNKEKKPKKRGPRTGG